MASVSTRLVALATISFGALCGSTQAQSFKNINEYCEAMAQASSVTLVFRTTGQPKQRALDETKLMTDPTAIRMVKEVIEFAYSRPLGSSVDSLRADLKKLCIERKVFAQ